MTRAAPQTSNPSLTPPVAFRRDGIAGPTEVLSIVNTKTETKHHFSGILDIRYQDEILYSSLKNYMICFI